MKQRLGAPALLSAPCGSISPIFQMVFTSDALVPNLKRHRKRREAEREEKKGRNRSLTTKFSCVCFIFTPSKPKDEPQPP